MMPCQLRTSRVARLEEADRMTCPRLRAGRLYMVQMGRIQTTQKQLVDTLMVMKASDQECDKAL